MSYQQLTRAVIASTFLLPLSLFSMRSPSSHDPNVPFDRPQKPDELSELAKNHQSDAVQRAAAFLDLVNQQLDPSYDDPEKLDEHLMQHLAKNIPPLISRTIMALQDQEDKENWPWFVLLKGPPGTGKTTWSRFICQFLKKYQMHHVVIPGSMFATEFIHSGGQNIYAVFNLLFEKAKKHPHIVVLEEVDAITEYHKSERDNTPKAFWTCLDRCKKNNVVVIGNTNNMDKTEGPILRRIKKEIPLTNTEHTQYRIDLVAYRLSRHKHSCTPDFIATLAKDTCRFTVSDMENLFSNAKQIARQRQFSMDKSKEIIITDEDMKLSYAEMVAILEHHARIVANRIDEDAIARRTLQLNEEGKKISEAQLDISKAQLKATHENKEFQEKEARKNRAAQVRSEGMQSEANTYASFNAMGPVGMPFAWGYNAGKWGASIACFSFRVAKTAFVLPAHIVAPNYFQCPFATKEE